MKTIITTCLALLLGATQSSAQIHAISFNEAQVDAKAKTVDLAEPMPVFEQVFAALGDQATVYPTENYYYFSFFANGSKYGGNLRFHPEDRDEGKLHFAFFDTSDPSEFSHLILTEKEGVVLNQTAALTYDVTYQDKTVSFTMNPVSQADPGAPTVHPGEVFVGRGFDESGIVFTLVFNLEANSFLWVLDPEQVMEVTLMEVSPGIQAHVLSGFVFYGSEDERRVLFAVDQYNAIRNNYYDGPFDQLPDNWLPETQFRELAERAIPSLAGMINDRGEYTSMDARVAIAPYMYYRTLGEVVTRQTGCVSSAHMAMMAAPAFAACMAQPSSS